MARAKATKQVVTIELLEAQIAENEPVVEAAQKAFMAAQQAYDKVWKPQQMRKDLLAELRSRAILDGPADAPRDWARLLKADQTTSYKELQAAMFKLFPDTCVSAHGQLCQSYQYSLQLRQDEKTKDQLDSIYQRILTLLPYFDPVLFEKVEINFNPKKVEDITGIHIDLLEPSLSEHGSYFLVGDEQQGWYLIYSSYKMRVVKHFATLRDYLTYGQEKMSFGKDD